MVDTTGNFLTSIRNAELAQKASLTVPFASMSVSLLEILEKTGYVSSHAVREDDKKKYIDIELPQPIVRHHYKRISKPGRRLYTSAQSIPMVLRGLGMVIVSTSSGIMTGKDARKRKLGGELICEVY